MQQEKRERPYFPYDAVDFGRMKQLAKELEITFRGDIRVLYFFCDGFTMQKICDIRAGEL